MSGAMMRAGSWGDHTSGSECLCVYTVSSEPFLHKGFGALVCARSRPGSRLTVGRLSTVCMTCPSLGNEG